MSLQKILFYKNTDLENSSEKIASIENLQRNAYDGYDLQTDMTISCQYNGIPCNVSNNFIQFWDNRYGNCYTFNADSAQKTSSTGGDHGLVMELVCSNNIFQT